jgi:hypothetical protein
MAEALVAIPFFILIFAGMLFIGNLYREKLRTHRVSMNHAWTDSLKGCDEGELGPLPVTNHINLGAAAGSPQAALCQTGFGKLSHHENGSVQRPSMIPGGAANATTYTHLICNEDPETGQFDGAADFLWNQFASDEFEAGGGN